MSGKGGSKRGYIGASFKSAVDFIQQRGLAKQVLADCSPETARLVEKPPVILSWMDFEAARRAGDADREARGAPGLRRSGPGGGAQARRHHGAAGAEAGDDAVRADAGHAAREPRPVLPVGHQRAAFRVRAGQRRRGGGGDDLRRSGRAAGDVRRHAREPHVHDSSFASGRARWTNQSGSARTRRPPWCATARAGRSGRRAGRGRRFRPRWPPPRCGRSRRACGRRRPDWGTRSGCPRLRRRR